MKKKIALLLTSCIVAGSLVGCSKNNLENKYNSSMQKVIDEFEEKEVKEAGDYYNDFKPKLFKDTVKDLRTEPVIDLSEIYQLSIPRDFYDTKLLYRDVTLLGTKIGDLLNSLEETKKFNANDYNSILIAPYHAVRINIDAADRDVLSGEIIGFNNSEKTIPLSDCILIGFDVDSEKYGYEEFGTTAVEFIEFPEDYNNINSKISVYDYTDDDISTEISINFWYDYYKEYIENNYEKHKCDNAKYKFSIGDKSYNLETLTYAQCLLEFEKIDSPFYGNVFGDVPIVEFHSLFEPMKDYQYLILSTSANIIENENFLFGGYLPTKIGAHSYYKSVNIFDDIIHSIKPDIPPYYLDTPNIELLGIKLSGTEEELVNSLKKVSRENDWILEEEMSGDSYKDYELETTYGDFECTVGNPIRTEDRIVMYSYMNHDNFEK